MSERVKFWVFRDQIYGVLDTARRFFFLHKLRVENTLERRILEGQYCRYNINITYEEEDVSFTE